MDPLPALLIPAAIALAAAGLVPIVVGWQLRALGVPTEPCGWPALPWSRLARLWSGWMALFAVLAAWPGAGGEVPWRLFAAGLQVGLAGGVVALGSWVGTFLDDDGPIDRKVVLVATVLLAASAFAGAAFALLALGFGLVLLWLASRPAAQASLASALVDLGAGMRLRARRLIGKDLDIGGIPVRIRDVGLVSSRIDDGAGPRALRNEAVLALLDQLEGDADGP